MKKGLADTEYGPIVLIMGTRPEAIKLIPLYHVLKRERKHVLICATTQHDTLLAQVFTLFGVKPDFDLQVMRPGQDLFYLTQSILQKTKELFVAIKPSMVVVQGDTTSSMAAALSAFYLKIPIVHVEAGLRTDDLYAPFPEEMNRRVISALATVHCAPTDLAVDALRAAGIPEDTIIMTGNTVVDALRIIKAGLHDGTFALSSHYKHQIDSLRSQYKTIVLLTAHRRESFNGGLVSIFKATKQFLLEHPDVLCVYPFHPNPSVIQAIATSGLSDIANIVLKESISYQEMVYLLCLCDIVMTDSGGLQEEAVSLGKSVLVLREKTERMEGVLAGFAHIVGTDHNRIYAQLKTICFDSHGITATTQIYGDGYASEKIAALIEYYQSMHSAGATSSAALPDTNTSIINKNIFSPSTTQKEQSMERICMVGLGYIGLPTAIVAADHGCTVIGVDIDEQRVTSINAGDPVIHEPEIYEKLQIALGSGRFHATTVMPQADYFVVAVPTPFKENKKADLSYVYRAGESIAPVLARGNVVIIESTIPVGTTDAFARFLQEKTGLIAGEDFYVAHCPERVLPGNIFTELVRNDRIIGGINQASVNAAKKLYTYFVQGTLYLTNAACAEMVKLVENSSRDVQIAFANQVASMAYSIGLNPFEVIELANKHPRVNILKPGCGVGGHCIAVDPWFLVETFPEHTALLHAARTVNDTKPFQVIECLERAVKAWEAAHANARCTVAVLGLTYKADVDDLRESPAMQIAQLLKTWRHIDLAIVEPHVQEKLLAQHFGDRVSSLTDAIDNADIVLILVGHTRFKALQKQQLVSKTVLDFCGLLYEPQKQVDQKEYMFWPARSDTELFSSPAHAVTDRAATQKEIS